MGQALAFALLLGTTFGLIGQLWQLALPSSMPEELPQGMEFLRAFAEPGIASFVIIPINLVIALFVMSAVVHVALMIVGGANSGFEATFRALAYATGAVAPLQLIPILGGLVGGIWSIVIQILAIKEIHGTTGGKATFAVLIIFILLCCCVGAGASMLIGGAAAGGGALEELLRNVQ